MCFFEKSLNPYEANDDDETDGPKLLATRVPFIFRLNNHKQRGTEIDNNKNGIGKKSI